MDLNEKEERELNRILGGAELNEAALDEMPRQQVDPLQVELMGVVKSHGGSHWHTGDGTPQEELRGTATGGGLMPGALLFSFIM